MGQDILGTTFDLTTRKRFLYFDKSFKNSLCLTLSGTETQKSLQRWYDGRSSVDTIQSTNGDTGLNTGFMLYENHRHPK